MLLKNFYEILETEIETPERTSFLVKLNTEHEIYQGHFPENPVVPGVCMVQMIKELLEKIEGRDLFMEKSDNMKFLNIVNPLKHSELNVRIVKRPVVDEKITIDVEIGFEEVIFFKFKGTYI
jgi:3-hydroxyacyl-[acyl-carrier-protein] dehydratase